MQLLTDTLVVLGSFDSLTLAVYGLRLQVGSNDQKPAQWKLETDLSALHASLQKKRSLPAHGSIEAVRTSDALAQQSRTEENDCQGKKDKVFAVEKKLVDFFSLCSAYKDSRDKIIGALSKLSKIRSQPRPTESDMVKSQAGKVTDCYTDLVNGINSIFEVGL